MWKILVFFFLISTSANAKEFHGYYVTNDSDTVQCVFDLQKKHKDFYDFSMVTKTIHLADVQGAKKFKPLEIVCFVINIPEEGEYKFISLEEDTKQFYQEIIKGKISLYKSYSRHSYDGSLAIIPVARKDKKLVYLNVANRKQRIGNLLADNIQLSERWKATKSNNWSASWFDTTEIEEYIRAYNKSESEVIR